jgi:hypothetical protein
LQIILESCHVQVVLKAPQKDIKLRCQRAEAAEMLAAAKCVALGTNAPASLSAAQQRNTLQERVAAYIELRRQDEADVTIKVRGQLIVQFLQPTFMYFSYI